MTKESEYFTGEGRTYNRNDMNIGITQEGAIYVNIDDEYIIDFPLEEVKKMSKYLQDLIKKAEGGIVSKPQTNCEKCIYYRFEKGDMPEPEPEPKPGIATIGRPDMEWCIINLRMTNPKCPLWDDGKEVKQ